MVSQKRPFVRKYASKVAKKNTRSQSRGRKSILRKRKNRNVSVKNRRRLKTKKNRRARKIRSKRLKYNMEGGVNQNKQNKLQILDFLKNKLNANIKDISFQYFVSALYKTYTAVNFKTTAHGLGIVRMWENGMFLPKVKLNYAYSNNTEMENWHPFIVLGRNCQRGIGPKISFWSGNLW